jgi:cell division protein ZapA (FtsZ GTPase activity inhibitor)
VELWIQGQRFEVRSDDPEAAREVARYVNEKISEASSRCGQAPRLNVLVLAALNMAEEHLALLKEHGRLRETVEAEARRLVGSIESVL